MWSRACGAQALRTVGYDEPRHDTQTRGMGSRDATAHPRSLIRQVQHHRAGRRRGNRYKLMKEQSGIIGLPESNMAIFSFLLNFVWEMWQITFFVAIPIEPHWVGVAACTQATFGDVAISLIAFWSVAALARSRWWIIRSSSAQVVSFVAVAVVITIMLEALATGPLERWSYTPSMPTLPITGTGILPLFQWILLPPLTIWFVRRQLT